MVRTVVENALEGRLRPAIGCRHVHAQIPPGQRDSRSVAVKVGFGHRQEGDLSGKLSHTTVTLAF